jgi:pimeloyl-ACP methyl ester carboxylesterase
MAVGGGVVGGVTHQQLLSVADDLVGHVVPDCGHLIPLERPEALVTLLGPFVA